MEFPATLTDALMNARAHLLAHRGQHGHWEGELSSSALSTAITVCALTAYRESAACTRHEEPHLRCLCENGLAWLVRHQNEDGGWGDTTLSFSNISTTSLCWAAFSGRDAEFRETVAACETWLKRAVANSLSIAEETLEPTKLALAIRKRYGKDHTFSVPILTTLTLTGRLGPMAAAWQLVPQLPFELAAFPHAWYAKLKLPVVSYALPALIAIGQVRFEHAPGWNLPLIWLRRAVRQRTLRVLQEIQPASGGYLEASPLTSFVSLSLIRAGRANHPVVRSGLNFLINSVRPDGSWAIDSNLATWVTTLSVNALSAGGQLGESLSGDELSAVKSWMLQQQYQVEHPYTHAAPGGWAWTDLPGGVPDADDTPGALLALHAFDDGSAGTLSAATAAVRWLLDLQNGDGGMPTFCRGWGTLPFDRSSADLTAHALRAWLAWCPRMPKDVQQRIQRGIARGLKFLSRTQRPDGAWSPLWFGNQYLEEEENPVYGTSRVLLAGIALRGEAYTKEFVSPTERGLRWLVNVQNADGGWNGGHAAAGPSSIEETALALDALCASLAIPGFYAGLSETSLHDCVERAVARGLNVLLKLTDGGRRFPATPIGFYFAKLWYFETLYPVIYSTVALERAAMLGRAQQETPSREGVSQ